jgi:HAD superfamily hydrolase (TIGR01490 family)
MDHAHHPDDSGADLQKNAPLKPVLALFDCDGTITTTDTLLAFLRFYRGNVRFWLGLLYLAPWLVLYQCKLLANWRAKNAALTYFVGGEPLARFQAKCDEFARTVMPGLVRLGALQCIRRYQAEGATVVVVSASLENWLQPWCDAMGMAYIGTRIEVENGRLTGRIAGQNCHGPEKVRRVLAQYDVADYAEIHAYGDSRGDRELLALASKRFLKPFRHATP